MPFSGPSVTSTWDGVRRLLRAAAALAGAGSLRGAGAGGGPLGDPGAEQVTAQHADDGEDEHPQDGQQAESDDRDGELAHRSPLR